MKKLICMCLLALAVTTLTAGCGKKTENATDGSDMAKAEHADDAKAEEEAAPEDAAEGTFMGNPWEDSDLESLQGKVAGVKLPVGAEDIVCRWNETIGMAEVDFTLYGEAHSMRFQQGDSFEDISGLEYEWESQYDTLIHDRTAKVRRAKDSSIGMDIDSVIWFDEEIGTNYSLYTEGVDLNGFDGEAVADSVYYEDGEEFYPNDFLQEKTGKDTFASFDEMIAQIEGDEAYAYVDLEGIDGQVLAITDGTYDNLDGNLAAIAAYFYAQQEDGTVRNIGNAFSFGTAYPISCDGKKIYSGGNHSYEELAICPETQSLIVTKSIVQIYDEEGNDSYEGFYRESADFDAEDKDIDIKSEEEFFACFDDYLSSPVIGFTKK